jgi:hypothetical protein
LTVFLSLPQQLQKKAKETPSVNVIPLPRPSDFIKPGKMCRAAGWGRTGVTEPTSDILREVKLRIMDKEACKNYWHYDYNLQVCVGSPRKKRSAYKVSTHLLFLPSSGNSIRGGSVLSISPWQYPMPVFLGC